VYNRWNGPPSAKACRVQGVPSGDITDKEWRMSEKIQWGLLATGAIAKAFARGLSNSRTGELWAVGSRTQDSANAFGAEFGAKKRYGSYEELLFDPRVQAVYVSTPHPYHAEWAIQAMDAGKHVLVEKPIGMHEYEAQAMIEAALRNQCFFMEAYMYRTHPQTKRMMSLLRDKVIGEVCVIRATFSFHAGFNAESRIWSNALGGGGILDVGGYTTSISRLIAGMALDRPYAEPISVTGAGHLHPETGVDAWALGTLRFDKGIVASISTGVGVSQENNVMVYGTKGSLFLPNPYVAEREGRSDGTLLVQTHGEPQREISIASDVTSYTHEADAVGDAIAEGKQESSAMTWSDSLGNIRTQDAWRDAIGLVYEAEKSKHFVHTLARRPLRVRKNISMTYGKIRHLDRPMPSLVMGVDNQDTMRHAAAVFDEYFERGGTAFDTAWVYGRTRSELLGQWIVNRNIRQSVILISKGAHTPLCNPEDLIRQVHEQLSWFQTDYADIYMLHRDNPEIPAGEFVDAVNQLIQEGKVKAYGGSNWSLNRVDQANAYAESKGLQGFSVVSNNLSLAEMIAPVWDGCEHAHDPASLAWFEQRQMALLPWSSQARGFFVPDRARPEKRDDPSMVRCWYSEANFQRQARAIELAGKYGIEPINIALAWVLQQPFPVFPLIGPRTLAEIRSTFRVFEVKLTEQEHRYLNLETSSI